MPTYEYECRKCGHAFERFQSITVEPLKRCPECRGKVRRLLGSGAGIIFKGSGFYQTDYRSEGYKSSAKKESADSSPPPSSAGKESAAGSPSSTSTDKARGSGTSSAKNSVKKD
jgi:putative FmdB family regulatory protein